METWTVEQLCAVLDPQNDAIVNRWLVRGDGVAVYRNVDMGHPDMGHRQFVSYGSPAAQLEGATPPDRLPDIGSAINWRYRLEAVYRGSVIQRHQEVR